MADMISRLKLESGEFDSKIKRAAQGIQRMADECHNAGAVLNVLEDENRKYIQSIGQMETVNKTARGSVAELTAAFMDMKHVYNQLSEDEKKGEVGRELNKQLSILKQRINEGNQEIRDMQQELNGGLGGALDSITAKFGVNIKQLVSFGTVLGAGSVALDVAKDAFFTNETQLDEWGRVVQSSESLYNGFLNALNTGDISGYLNSIDDIVDAARDAYDALDSLSTFNAFTRGSRAGLRSNYSEALNEYKLNPTAENKKRLDDANKALIEGMQQQADKMRYAYEKSLNSLGVDRLLKGERLEEFKNLFRSGNYEELERMKAGYSQGKMLNAGSQYWYGDKVYDGKIQDRSTGLWRAMDENEKKQFEFARVLSQVNDKQIDSIQALDEQYKNTLDAINNQNRSYNRLSGNNGRIKPTRPHRSGASSLNIGFDATRAGLAGVQGVDTMPSVWAMLGEQGLKQVIGTPEKQWDYGRVTDEAKGDWAVQKDKAEKTLADELKKNSGVISGLSGGLNSISSGIEAMGFDLPDEIDSMINGITGLAQIISGVGSIIELFSTSSEAANTVAVNANTVAIGGLITALEMNTGTNLIPFFANGGVVPHAQNGLNVVGGTHYSGDVTPILANAGEVVLNHAQVNNLAHNLQGGGLQNIHLEAVVTGEQIRLVLKNNDRLRGGGMNVTFK